MVSLNTRWEGINGYRRPSLSLFVSLPRLCAPLDAPDWLHLESLRFGTDFADFCSKATPLSHRRLVLLPRAELIRHRHLKTHEEWRYISIASTAMDTWLSGSHSPSRSYGRQKHLLPLPGAELRSFRCPSSSLVAVPTGQSKTRVANNLSSARLQGATSASQPQKSLSHLEREGQRPVLVDSIASIVRAATS